MGFSSESFIDLREKEFTYNATFKVTGKSVTKIEKYLSENTNLIDYHNIKDTSLMYENDPIFKKMVKEDKLRKKHKLDYINKNNHKHK